LSGCAAVRVLHGGGDANRRKDLSSSVVETASWLSVTHLLSVGTMYERETG
jgi:hypothetical protein